MSINLIKNKLMQLNILYDNNYLTEYAELISKNINTKVIRGKTQRHHIIPRCYYKHNKIEDIKIINQPDNLINLSYRDHILAHYYLALCAKESWFEYANIYALCHLINCNRDSFDINLLDRYDELYNKRIQHISNNISNRYKGNIHIYKDDKEKHINKKDLEYYLSKGWSVGTLQDKLWVYKEGKNYHINKCDLEHYLGLGYVSGRGNTFITEKTKKLWSEQRKDVIYINNGLINKCVKKCDIDSYIDNGWQLGKLTNNQYKGLIWIHKDNKNKRIYEKDLELYLTDGWVLGRNSLKIKDPNGYSNKRREVRLKYFKSHESSSKGKVWIIKEDINKLIFPEELEKYISLGWRKGKKHNRQREV